jgi:hypothetical protein
MVPVGAIMTLVDFILKASAYLLTFAVGAWWGARSMERMYEDLFGPDWKENRHDRRF